MKQIFECRRSSLALIGIAVLGTALFFGHDTSAAISAICMGVAGANAYEKGKK